MQQSQTDSLGRATFHHIAAQAHVRPTERELRWLKHIERHGPQNSQYLYELTRDTHRCKDTALRQMQKLRAGGFLSLPRQQRATERAEFNPYIYDLTRKAKDYLTDLELAEPTVRPTGHWWHGYSVSCVTSSIDIAASRDGVRFLPAHRILARTGNDIGIPTGNAKLIPDQLFALDYGGKYRAFALEVDRGTEPTTSPAKRKSWARSIAQYRHVTERGLHRPHYGLKSNLLVMWVFTSEVHENRFWSLVEGSPFARHVLTQVHRVDSLAGSAVPMPIKLWHEPWRNADGTGIAICIA